MFFLNIALSALSVGLEIIITSWKFLQDNFFSPSNWSTIFSGVQYGALFAPILKLFNRAFYL